MNWLSEFSLVMRSSVTALREKVEDPERMLHQLIIDMQCELDRVRASVAEAIADEIQMRKRCKRERNEVQSWQDRAAAAMQRKDERTARSALEQKQSAQQRSDQYETEHTKQADAVRKLQDSVRDLEDKIRQATQKKTLLMARMTRASTTQNINAAMDRCDSQSAFAQFGRLEAKVDREEAVSEAWDRMDGKDPDAKELERQFEHEEQKERVNAELEALKAELAPEDAASE
jgi:phage shock protein A